eukprot:COSAG01_NODE_16_length_40091_cov_15.728646_44_plen_57_part_00
MCLLFSSRNNEERNGPAQRLRYHASCAAGAAAAASILAAVSTDIYLCTVRSCPERY